MQLPLFIFGTGSLAKLAHYYAIREMGLDVLGFVVDAHVKHEDLFCGLPVLSWDHFLTKYPAGSVSVFVAIGYRIMRERQTIFDRIQGHGYDLQSIISKSAFVAETSSIGINSFIMPNVVIEPGVIMGANNIFWSNTTVCHDTRLGSHNFFASSVTIGGEVTIGDCCFFGFNSTVVQLRHIGSDVLLAAQSLLLNDVEGLSRYQGQPARKFEDLVSVGSVSIK
jgi:sugar O-acyltransferase (sialic acid O-acetyltransferase NeuD family)